MCQIWSFDQICLLFSFQGMNCIYQVYTSPAFCTPSALRKPFLDAHRMQSDVSILKKLTRCSALAGSHRAFSKNVWQPPALPCRLQHSTIGRTDLHRRVRDGNGCCLRTHRHQTNLSMWYNISFYMRIRQKRNPYFLSLERR